ncbi:hypothetical protein [Devosia sp. A16]|uniref:hypothetical protein n=1 Tax=Devosia sp. A16 TaxID=1736675 RepID=UPI0006D819AF|nr:hypothetical protein [Devosia sp. A16]
MHKLLIGIAIAVLWCGTANAAGVSRGPCETPEIIDYIKTSLKNMKSENGESFARYLGDNSRLAASTMSADARGFVCKVNVSVVFGGNTQKIRGRFVYREFSGKRASVTFIPF